MSEVDLEVRRAFVVGEPAASFSKNTGTASGPNEGVAPKQPLKSGMNNLVLSKWLGVFPTLAPVANPP